MAGKLKFAFMGFRHGHILAVYQRLAAHPQAEIVAACEEHEPTRLAIAAAGQPVLTDHDFAAMLDRVVCDAVAIGDYYGRRGALALAALRRGKHVLSDKPFCTTLEEWREIRDLVRARGLALGCQFSLRDSGVFLAMRALLRAGEIGPVHAVGFNGQHPLLFGRRPAWYFEPGKHGGTLNDIAIHALDLVPWLTGLRFQTLNAARAWNARLPQAPHFREAAQLMLTLENGGGVLGDVSYLAPDSQGYSLPQSWRFTVWGEQGLLENTNGRNEIMLFKNGEQAGRAVPAQPGRACGYLEDFIRAIRGETDGLELTTAEVLAAGRLALLVQDAADRQLTNVPLDASA